MGNLKMVLLIIKAKHNRLNESATKIILFTTD